MGTAHLEPQCNGLHSEPKQVRVYLSGSIKDDPNYVEKFSRYEAVLWNTERYDDVINPVTIDHAPDASYGDYMRNDIAELVCCHEIAMIPGWEVSQGAKLEFMIATMCGMKVTYL